MSHLCGGGFPTHLCPLGESVFLCTLDVHGSCSGVGNKGILRQASRNEPVPPPLQDSLLAAPIILDLVILAELCQRIRVSVEGETEPQQLHSALSLLSFLCKAPLVPDGAPVVNALFRQRAAIENLFR